MRRFARNFNGYIALLALAATFLEATQANYAGVACQAFIFLLLVRLHIDALELDRACQEFYRTYGVDLADYPKHLVITGRMRLVRHPQN